MKAVLSRWSLMVVGLALGWGMATQQARAMINPNFTPVHLLEQSEAVLQLEFQTVDKEGKATATVKNVLKGKDQPKTLEIDLLAGASKDEGQAVVRLIQAGKKQAVMFVGQFDAGVGDPEQRRAFLHMDGRPWQWLILSGQDKAWDLEKQEAHLLGTWAGGTDMLIRAIEAIRDDEMDVPTEVRESWGKPVACGRLAGRVSAIQAISLPPASGAAGGPAVAVFVACTVGDKLYQHEAGKLVDITAARKLTSKSAAACWSDLTGDGKLDLLSWSGKSFSLHVAQEDGTFAARDLELGDALKGGCLGLAEGPISAETRSVIITTLAMPIVVTFTKGQPSARPLAEGEFAGGDLGKVTQCLVADLNNDGTADVLQLAAKGSLLYLGKADERGQIRFGPAQRCAVAAGEPAGADGSMPLACLGDYDADGRLDVLTAGVEGCQIWQNMGRQAGVQPSDLFVPSLPWSGEISYIAKPRAIAGVSCDINNDGRQDILIGYANLVPQVFFNRGFRSYGHARSLDLDKALPEANAGQQAVCVADINGDGAQDLVLALKDGSVYLVPRETKGRALGVRVELSPSLGASPVIVTAQAGHRSLGAWNVTSASTVFFGMKDAGELSISWTGADRKPQTQRVRVVEKPAHVVIGQK